MKNVVPFPESSVLPGMARGPQGDEAPEVLAAADRPPCIYENDLFFPNRDDTPKAPPVPKLKLVEG